MWTLNKYKINREITDRDLLSSGGPALNRDNIPTAEKSVLLNVGFMESRNRRKYDCYIFHDVDLLPENDRIPYECDPTNPRHISVAVDKFNYSLPYSSLVGGISAFTEEQYERVNGYSNIYWGWGGEDDDLARRIASVGYNIKRMTLNTSRFTMLKHAPDIGNDRNPARSILLRRPSSKLLLDGLNNVKYRIAEVRVKPLYTLFAVDVGVPQNIRKQHGKAYPIELPGHLGRNVLKSLIKRWV